MDRECVSLLPRVCEVLAASGSSLPDDTILEKLLDWFTALTEAGESLLEACPCLLEFISAVIHDTASAPGVLSFTLRLIGLLAAAEDAFRILKESLVLDLVFSCKHWQELGLWEDPCIRIGWIQGLRTTLQHPNGLSFFIQPLLQLQTDTSLFVASAANQMLAHVLLFCQPVSSVGSEPMEINQDCTAVVDAISEYLKRALGVPKGSTQLHQCQQTLRLLALLLGQTKPPLRDKLLQTVTASLEEMVAADCCELTLPLMDVILDPDCLPCAPDLIVSGILSLLRICSGDSFSSSAGCSEVFRNVIGSGKVQKCALEALTAVSNSPDDCVIVFQVLHKSYQALVKWMSVSCAIDLHNKSHCLCLLDLIQVVKKRACDMRWEVRDSTMEFLGHLGAMHVCQASAEQACDASEALLGGCCCTTPLLREALQDPESYVRASAIKALAQTVMHSWQEGAAPTQEQILSQDTEGFARRAVVKFFIAWFSSHSSHTPPSSPSVRSVLSRGSADLDWEVKVHTLELAELLLDKAFLESRTQEAESDLVEVLNSLVEQGVISALLSGLVDCDRPVALKACRLLITLRVTVCPASQGDPDVCAATANAERDLNALNATSFEDHSEEGASAVSHCEHVSVCEALGSLGLDERLEILSRSSDHVHNSPLSLLQDILTASTSHTHANTQPGQEVIVDCY
uniref:BRCA1-associated ATM activator 1 n=1 Tax=Oreochromis niloticus TaxID=8128 RepID=I3J5I6_ORENI